MVPFSPPASRSSSRPGACRGECGNSPSQEDDITLESLKRTVAAGFGAQKPRLRVGRRGGGGDIFCRTCPVLYRTPPP